MAEEIKLYPAAKELPNEADVFFVEKIEIKDIPTAVMEKFEVARNIVYGTGENLPSFYDPQLFDHKDGSKSYSVRVERAQSYKSKKDLEQIYVADVIENHFAGMTEVTYWQQGGEEGQPREIPYVSRTGTQSVVSTAEGEQDIRKRGLNARRYIVADIHSRRAWGKSLRAGYWNDDAHYTWKALKRHGYVVRDRSVPLNPSYIGAYRFKKKL